MDPFTLAIVFGSGWLGAKYLPPLIERLKPKPAQPALPPPGGSLAFDPGLSDFQRAELANLLAHVSDRAILRAAAASYRAQGFLLAASALEAKARG